MLLVDDDALVRSGLSMMLDGAHNVEVVGEVGDGDEVGRAVDARPNVILIDVRCGASTGSPRHGGCAPALTHQRSSC